MGARWRSHPAWSIVERAEAAVGESLSPLLLDERPELFERTRAAQVAVFLASLIVWEASKDALPQPIAFAGHSLGQLTALVAAGVLSVEDGTRLVDTRGRLTQRAARQQPGAMAALRGFSPEQAAKACSIADGRCWLANDNAPGQVVVGGTAAGVAAVGQRALDDGARRVVPLKVEGAFHTPLMAGACRHFARALSMVQVRPPSAPVVSNGDAWAYWDGEGWRQRLVDHLIAPVRWRQSMQTLVELGAARFVEMGPGATVAGLAKRTVPSVPVVTIGVPEQVPRKEGRDATNPISAINAIKEHV
jgi:[acyl-carrier-protein] S-malonyltransferase